MKKLLSLLSVLTISVATLPMTISASFYKKIENELENNKINDLKINKIKNYVGITKIVVSLKKEFTFFEKILNKIYFGTKDGNIHEYDPVIERDKIIITNYSEKLKTDLILLNNKIYFCSDMGNIYEYDIIDPTIKKEKIIVSTNKNTHYYSDTLNNKIYYWTIDNDIYEYDQFTKKQQKIMSYFLRIPFKINTILNNKIYYFNNLNICEYDIITKQEKIIKTLKLEGIKGYFLVELNNKIYWGIDLDSGSSLYEYNPFTKKEKEISKPIKKVFFHNSIHLHYNNDFKKEQQNIVAIINDNINYLKGIFLNNKMYFWDGLDVYEHDFSTEQQKVIFRVIEEIVFWTKWNNKLYFGTNDGTIYEYDPTNNGCGEAKVIFRINDKMLYGGFYLNNKLYFSTNDGTIYEYESLELIETDIVDLQEQIRRGIYLYFKEQNPNYYVKNIEFNMNNLKYYDINLLKKELISFNIKKDENICAGNAKFENKTSDEQEYQTQNCKYIKQNTESYQLLKGLNKRTDNTLEKGINNSSASSTLNSKSKNKSSQTDVGINAGGSFLGINLGGSISHSKGTEESTSIQLENSKSKTENISNIISNSSSIDLTIINDTQDMGSKEIEFPSQKVKVSGNQTRKVTFFLYNNITKNKFTFNQKISGKIKIKIINEYGIIEQEQDLLIKDIMSSLKNNNLLPKEIIINDDGILFRSSFFLNKIISSDLNMKTEDIETI